MTRKMAYIGLSYISGLFLASFFIPSINLVIAFWLIAIATLHLIFFKNKTKLYVIAFSASVALIFNAVYSLAVLEKVTSHVNKSVVITGTIQEKTLLEGGKSRYIINGDFDDVKNANVLVFASGQQGEVGDKFSAKINLTAFEDTLSFPEKSYYKSKGIYLKSYDAENILIEQNTAFSLKKSINNYKEIISNKISLILPHDEGDFVKSIICGDKTALNEDVKTNLYRSGIGHITSVSGAHLMIIAGLLYLLLNLIPITKFKKFIILEIFIVSYAIFVGMSISIIRATIMFSLVASADVFKRKADVATSLGIAGILLTLTNPYSVRDASFLLSFTGVMAIAVIAPYINSYLDFKGRLKNLKKSLVAMVSVSIFTMPFVIMISDELSIISPLSNIFLAPIYTAILILGFLVVITGGLSFFAYPILLIAGLLTKVLLFLCEKISSLSFSYVLTGFLHIQIAVPLCVFTIIIICLKFKTAKSAIASVLCGIIILLTVSPIMNFIEKNNLYISLLYHSNNVAIVLNKNDQTCIIDISGGGNACATIDTYISRNGIKSVNSIILTSSEQKALSSYKSQLSFQNADYLMYNKLNIVYPKDYSIIEFKDNNKMEFNGVTVTRISQDEFKIDYDDFSINILSSIQNGLEGNSIIATSSNIAILKDNKVVLNSTKNEDITIQIKAKKSGKYNIRGTGNGFNN